MNNTIIINKILVHMIDFEHRRMHFSETFAPLDETTRDYYHKKIEKAFYNTGLKSLTVSSMHELYLRAQKMYESEELFKVQAKDITTTLFELGTHVELMPNCTVLYIDMYITGTHYIGVLKLNYKLMPVSIVEEDNVHITKRQVLPSQGAPVDEAIFINPDHHELFLLEKKYMIDGKNDTYLNKQWIKGEEDLTDRQKYNTMKKVVERVENEDALPIMKSLINETLVTHEPIKPVEIIKQVTRDNEEEREAALLVLENAGIGENDSIHYFGNSKMMSKCKIVTDTEIEVIMDLEDYLQKNNIEIQKDDNGHITVLLKNIDEFYLK